MPYPWSEETVELAKKLAASGMSSSQAAKQIPGMTRSGMLGLAHRRGFQFFGSNGKHTKDFQPLNDRSDRAPRHNRPRKAKPVKIEIIFEEPRMITLTDLREDDCKFPMGDPITEAFRYCGAHRVWGRPYCHRHSKISYETPQERERARSQQRRPGSSGFFNNAVRHGGIE